MRKVIIVETIQRIHSVLNVPLDELDKKDTITVCYEDLRNMNLHKLFASVTYELEIVATPSMNFKFNNLLHSRASNFTLTAAEPYSANIVKFLCDIFPEEAPAIRRSAMQGKSIKQLLGGKI